MRITLPNLTPGTTYVIKARSKSGADYSEWSRSITLTTSGDALPPKTPANPVGSMNGTSFSLKWDAVTQNSDNTALNDLDRYEVEVTSAGTATVGVYPTKDTKFEFSFEQNANLFGSPRANIKMRVRAVDLVGNASAYTSIVDQTNPAPAAPTGLAGNAGTYSLSFTWNAVADLDLKQYRIYSGTSAGTQSTLVWTGTALNATIQLVDTTTDRWYKVVAVDVFNTESTASNVVGPIKPLSPVVVDVTPPAVPTNLAGTLTNATDGKTASMAVTWTGVSDNDLDSYVVAFRQFASPVNDWQYVTVSRDATSTTIQGLVPYKAHDIRIRAKDFSANYSNWSTIVAVSAQANTAPATVTGLAVTAGKDNLQISWTESAEEDVKNNAGAYEVTVATNSGFTTGVLNYKTAATTLSVNGLAQNTQYYVRVRAVDSAGMTSAAWSTSANATTSNFSGGSDGAVPVGAVTLSASAGIGYIYLSWTPLANNDPVVYDVYMSTTSGFTTYDATTKITEVSGTSAFIDTIVGGSTLVYGTTYYFKVRARDKDGVSTTVSNQASAAPAQAASTDLTPAVNTSITTAQTTADNAQTVADSADAFNLNPNFSKWSAGLVPDNWSIWNAGPTHKETTLVRTPPNAVRFNCTDTTTQRGIQEGSTVNIPMTLGLDYVTITLDVMLNSGTSFGGSGWLFDWTGMTGSYRYTGNLAAEIPNPVTGKWYRVSRVMKKGATASGTQTAWGIFLMGQYSSMGSAQAIKDVIFNRVAVRPSTTEEISAYNAAPASTVTDLTNQVNSKGTDLVTNGTGLLGTNYNFSQLDYNGADAPVGTNGSFVSKVANTRVDWLSDELIPFDPNKKYKISMNLRQTVAGGTGRAYGGFAPYDAAGNIIYSQSYMFIPNTTTTLAQALNPGDTTIVLTSAANWYGQTGKPAGTTTYARNIIFWDYVDPFGKAWPVGTYSRNYLTPDLWADGSVDLATNTITLRAPYAGPVKPAGTPVSNASAGNTYIYMNTLSNVQVPETWTAYTDTFTSGVMGVGVGGSAGAFGQTANWTTGLPMATAKVKMLAILNYTPNTGKHAIAGVSLSDAQAAQATADASSKTYIQSSTPVGRSQDLWIDTTGGNNTPKRWNGSAWVAVTDKAATDAATAATNSSMTYIQSTAPAGRSQDLWIDTTAGANTPKRWNGSAWVAVTDQAAVAAAQTYTDTKFQASLKNTVVEYSVNSSETVAPTTGWSSATPTRTPGTFVWYRTVLTFGDNSTSTSNPALLTGNTGATGSQGIPGPAGSNGTSLYTWIKYADTPTTGMSDSPTGKTYMGIAYNKTSATESSVYSDYEWSLIKGADGAQGIQGPVGANGQPTYTWIKYGTSNTGAGLSDDPTGKTYIGIAYNKTTPTESTVATDYEWSLIQGPQGATGATGPAGAPAALVSLTATTQVLTQPASGGATNPATAVVTGTAINTTISVWEYSVNGGAFSATVPAGVSRTGNVVTITGATMTARTITVRMADANGVADTLTVAEVIDGATGATGATGPTGSTGAAGAAGADAYTVILTNEAQVFPGTTNAAVAGSATTQVIAYKGAAQQTATIGTITGQVTGLTTSITNNGTNNPTVTVTVTSALVTQSGTLTIPVTVGGIVFTKTFAWSVSYTGATGATGPAGANAADINLTATSQVLTSPAGGGATNPTTSTVTGVATNTTITAWTYSVDGAAFSATVPAGVSRAANVVTITGSTMTARTIAVRMADANGVADTLTVAKAFDGATGATGNTGPTGNTGSAGADAYTVLLSNEAQTFTAGTTNANAATATSTVIAYKGTVAQVATVGTITGGATGITAAVTNNGTTAPLITFTVTTALATANGTFTIPVTVGGMTFNQVFSWALAFTGVQGTTGAAGAPASVVDLVATSQALISPAGGGATTPATSTITGTATNTTISTWTYSVDGGAFSGTLPAGVAIAGNVVTITGATMTAKTIAVRATGASGVTDTMTVAKVSDGAQGATGATGGTGSTGAPGAAGADAYTVVLTNEAQVFAGTTTNAIADATKSTSVIAYKGAVQQTASITQANITGMPTGMTAAVTNNGTSNVTVTFTVTTAMTSPSGAVTIPVVVGGITFNKVFSYSIAFAGAQGATGSTGATGPAGSNGVSITGVTPYFYQVTPANGTAPTVTTPTASTPGAGWTTTEPTYVKDSALYRTERISYSNSTYAYTAVYRSSAYDAAAAAQTTADGKNKIVRSLSDATGAAGFVDGDLWWKLDANGNVIKQWKFVVGGATPGWNVEALMDGVLGSLNANKIVAGTTFTQDLFVKSKFTLGDATTPGVIESYNFNGTTGFSLSSSGLIINSGQVDAKTLTANSSFVTNLFIGAGGAIQSTGFNASTGFQLSTSGLIIRGAGNSVDVGAVTAGTITGKQWIMGTGGSFIVDQNAYFQSNNYSGGTLGWRLDATGLTIRNGSIDAKALISSTIDAATITLSGASGKIVGTGFTLAGNGLTVTTGSISAPALQIQDSDNVMPPAFAGFEFTPAYYTNNMLSVANVTGTIVSTGAKFQSQFMQLRTTTAAAFDAYLGASTTDYNVVVDEPSVTYILSAWVKTGAVASTATLKVKLSNGTILTAVTQALPANGAWQRISGTVIVPAGITSLVAIVGCTTATVGAGVDIDGVQLERQMGGLTTPSPWTAPGMTSADGGVLRTGEIRSNTNVTVNGVQQPAWSINMSGGAQFGNAVVRGAMIVGNSGVDADAGQSFIASGNFVASTTGWKIDSSGNLEANQGLFRGSLNVGGRAGSSVSIIAGDPIGIRAEMTDFGFKSFAIGDEGTVYEAVSFGTSSDNKLEIHNAAGDTVAGIDATGVVTAGGANLGASTGPTFDTDGNFLTGVQIYGQEFQRIIDALPRGIVASSFTANFQVSTITTTFGLGEVSYDQVPGRNYRLTVNHANLTPTVATDRFVYTYRYTTDGTAPTITSPVFDRQIVSFNSTNPMTPPPFVSMRTFAGGNGTIRILVCIERLSGTGSVQVSTNAPSVGFKAYHLMVEDVGQDVSDTFLNNQGNGQIGGGAAQPPPPVAKKTYVKTYTSTGSGSYRENGVKRTDNGGKIYQGRSSAGSINGIQQGLWIFPDMTGDLSGATVSKIEVYLYANFWYYNSGGTASIATHAHQTTVPTANPSLTYRIASANWPKPGGRWVTLPNTLYGSFQSGSIRGIGVYTASPSLTLYGSFNSTAQIRVTYVK